MPPYKLGTPHKEYENHAARKLEPPNIQSYYTDIEDWCHAYRPQNMWCDLVNMYLLKLTLTHRNKGLRERKKAKVIKNYNISHPLRAPSRFVSVTDSATALEWSEKKRKDEEDSCKSQGRSHF